MPSSVRFRAWLLVLLFLIVCPSPAHAAWQPAGASAPTTLGFSDGSGNLISGAAAVTKRNSSDVVAWTVPISLSGPTEIAAVSDRAGGGVYSFTLGGGTSGNLFANRVTSAGALAWTQVTVCNAANEQGASSIAVDQLGNTFIAWKDRRAGGTTYQFFVQKLDPSGVPEWTPNGMPLATPASFNSATPPLAVVPDESGGCYFIWQDNRPGVQGSTDVYAQWVSAGVAQWGTGGIAFCVAAGTQNNIQAIPDGVGGAILEWMDQRSGEFDIYAQRLNSAGAALWAANGVGVAVVAGSDQGNVSVLPDGSGGIFFAWEDCRNCGSTGVDIYAQRFDASGAALWTSNGVVVANGPAQEQLPAITSDGSGGIIAGFFAGTLRAQRLDGSGAPQWQANGIEQLVNPVTPTRPLVVTDGAGGAYIGAGGVLGRVLPTGEPAWPDNYRPTITSVSDVALDEGGWVTVNFAKPLSDGSTLVNPQTTAYSVWRKRPGSVGAGPGRLMDPRDLLARSGRTAEILGYADFPSGIWETLGYFPAMRSATYSLVVPTHTDSTAAGSANEDLVVVSHMPPPAACCPSLLLYVVSAVGSGHSVDNLAPGPPQNVAGGYAGGTTVQIQWTPSAASDLWHYSVYKGTSPGFVPSAGNRIGQPTAASLQDDAYEAGVSHYKVSAIDRHGNESGFTLLSPSQITSVPPGANPGRAYLAAPAPNPFRDETVFEYGVAHDGPVKVEIYDLRGRRIARIVDEVQTAGVRKAAWDGLDEARRRVGAGVYVVRFTTGDVSERRKLIHTN